VAGIHSVHRRSALCIYHIYAGADGESHGEAMHVAQHPELGALKQAQRLASGTKCRRDEQLMFQ
jgi:hypothetical protein